MIGRSRSWVVGPSPPSAPSRCSIHGCPPCPPPRIVGNVAVAAGIGTRPMRPTIFRRSAEPREKKIGQRHDSIADDVVDCRNSSKNGCAIHTSGPIAACRCVQSPTANPLSHTTENETPMSRLGRSVLHLSTVQNARSRHVVASTGSAVMERRSGSVVVRPLHSPRDDRLPMPRVLGDHGGGGGGLRSPRSRGNLPISRDREHARQPSRPPTQRNKTTKNRHVRPLSTIGNKASATRRSRTLGGRSATASRRPQ